MCYQSRFHYWIEYYRSKANIINVFRQFEVYLLPYNSIVDSCTYYETEKQIQVSRIPW